MKFLLKKDILNRELLHDVNTNLMCLEFYYVDVNAQKKNALDRDSHRRHRYAICILVKRQEQTYTPNNLSTVPLSMSYVSGIT